MNGKLGWVVILCSFPAYKDAGSKAVDVGFLTPSIFLTPKKARCIP